MANYRTGARLERRLRAHLIRNGYSVVRSAGSKGAIDLVACNAETILLIQAKKNLVTRADRRKMRDFKAPPLARKQFWLSLPDGDWMVVPFDDKLDDPDSPADMEAPRQAPHTPPTLSQETPT